MACDTLIEDRGYIAIFGRIGDCPQQDRPPQAYCGKVNANGVWQLLAQTNCLATGTLAVRPNEWHRLALRFAYSNITFLVDNKETVTIQDVAYTNGMAGLGAGFNGAQFDNFEIRPVAETGMIALGLVANLAEGKAARASSGWGEGYQAANAFDGDEGTRWNSAKGDLVGAWLEVDFGKPTRFDSLSASEFQPRIRRYEVQVPEGSHWRTIYAGDLRGESSWRCSFPSVTVSSLRLVVLATYTTDPEQGTPSLFEVQVFDGASAR